MTQLPTLTGYSALCSTLYDYKEAISEDRDLEVATQQVIKYQRNVAGARRYLSDLKRYIESECDRLEVSVLFEENLQQMIDTVDDNLTGAWFQDKED